MRKAATALALLLLLTAGSAEAKKRHHKRAGVKGVVRDASCHGACVEPPPPEPPYSGEVTVTVRRVRDGALVASRTITDGRFRIKVRRGRYDVSSVPPSPAPQPCPPGEMCPLAGGTESPAVIRQCVTGETKRVKVRRHRFSRIELHVTNSCIV